MPTNGPYGAGGFKGKGPRGNRLPKQRPSQNKGCCSYQEAARAIFRRKYRLAARFVRMDIKARLGVI